jgi:hypothetical protein
MHQFADPYNADDSAIVDSDGVVLLIAEADKILALAPYNYGVLVFAENGVWYVASQEGFKTTSIAIQKISDTGIVSKNAVCLIENGLVFFGENGIFGIKESTTGSGFPEAQSISDKIISLYTAISSTTKAAAYTVYEKANKRVYYFYHDLDSSVNFNKCLVYDLRINVWYKHEIKSADTYMLTSIISIPEAFDSSSLLFFIQDDSNQWAFALFQDGVWSDFSSVLTEATSYSSYITMAHQHYGTVMRKREAPYLTTVFERVDPVYEGGCLMRVDWNWALSGSNVYFGTPRQVYFPNKYISSLYSGANTETQVVISKHKIRGWGNVFRFHFENDGDKPFKLLGWELLVNVDPTP